MRSIRKARAPSAFIVLPVLVAVGLAVFATVALGALAGIIVGIGAALAAAAVVESPVQRLAALTHKIAHGDRYAILPRQKPGTLAAIAKSIDVLRGAVLEADSLAVDQRRREAEARLHMASRSFFTGSFRGAVDDVVKAFTDGSAWIGQTATDLEERNRQMHGKVANASDAAVRIDEVVGLIQSIARKTSLLSLNASIEAARAGAAGQASPWWPAR